MRRRLPWPILLLAMLLVSGLVLRLTPFWAMLKDPTTAGQAWFSGFAAWAPLVFVLLSASLQTVGCPRTLFGAIAGAIFGFWVGLGLALTASLVAAIVVYAIARKSGRTEVPERLRRLFGNDWRERRTTGIGLVFLVRQIPLPGMVLSAALGRLHVSPGNYLLGTLLGYLPLAVPSVAMGSSLQAHNHWAAVGLGLTALAVVVLVGGFLRRLGTRTMAEPSP